MKRVCCPGTVKGLQHFNGSAYVNYAMLGKTHLSGNVYIPTACLVIWHNFFISHGSALARLQDRKKQPSTSDREVRPATAGNVKMPEC